MAFTKKGDRNPAVSVEVGGDAQEFQKSLRNVVDALEERRELRGK